MNEILEEKSLDFLKLIFSQVSIDDKKKWGMKVYHRFKTKVWKSIESTETLQEFVNSFFEYSEINLTDILDFLDSNKSEQAKIFQYIRKNLVILIGRLQAKNKEKADYARLWRFFL